MDAAGFFYLLLFEEEPLLHFMTTSLSVSFPGGETNVIFISFL